MNSNMIIMMKVLEKRIKDQKISQNKRRTSKVLSKTLILNQILTQIIINMIKSRSFRLRKSKKRMMNKNKKSNSKINY